MRRRYTYIRGIVRFVKHQTCPYRMTECTRLAPVQFRRIGKSPPIESEARGGRGRNKQRTRSSYPAPNPETLRTPIKEVTIKRDAHLQHQSAGGTPCTRPPSAYSREPPDAANHTTQRGYGSYRHSLQQHHPCRGDSNPTRRDYYNPHTYLASCSSSPTRRRRPGSRIRPRPG